MDLNDNGMECSIKEKNTVEIAKAIVAYARELGVMDSNEHMLFTPEPLLLCDVICSKFQDNIDEICSQQHMSSAACTLLALSAYGGVASVYYWRKDWGRLKRESLFQIISQECMGKDMNKYFCALMGFEHGAEEQESFCNLFNKLCDWVWEEYYHPYEYEDRNLIFSVILDAMHIFGMLLQTERMGLEYNERDFAMLDF